ncbi:hypothetical protein FRB94_009902 [Tulasnella sp. JGI-2019a]|nr:hypothetical protein FRB94_009902 [Tulasnella sp. JGI-2019a]KAG9034613.1 hypothetical protein FRB95_012933 [Tulasnella sp. JGI-2019a]
MDHSSLGPLNPFDLIPNEILAHILSLSTHTADPTQLTSYLDRDTVFPFTALRSCKRWRDVTHNTPEIWAVAAIVSRREGLPRLMEHARRCGDRPLDVSINIDDTRTGCRYFLRDLHHDLDVKLLHKIKHLRMICRRKEFYSACLHMYQVTAAFTRLGVELEGLEWLVVEGMDFRNQWSYAALFLIKGFETQPNLRSLRLSGFRLFARQTMDGRGSLPKLEVLVLDDCIAYIIDVFPYVDMPVLHTLSITTSDDPDPDPTAPSVTMSATIAHIPSVQQLTLIDIPTLQDLTKILSSVPNVKHLTLGGRWTLEVFDSEVEGLVSHLESLQIMGLSTKIDMPKVKSVVASRLDTLREVTVDVGRGEVADVKEMEEFRWLQEHVTLTLNAR